MIGSISASCTTQHYRGELRDNIQPHEMQFLADANISECNVGYRKLQSGSGTRKAPVTPFHNRMLLTGKYFDARTVELLQYSMVLDCSSAHQRRTRFDAVGFLVGFRPA